MSPKKPVARFTQRNGIFSHPPIATAATTNRTTERNEAKLFVWIVVITITCVRRPQNNVRSVDEVTFDNVFVEIVVASATRRETSYSHRLKTHQHNGRVVRLDLVFPRFLPQNLPPPLNQLLHHRGGPPTQVCGQLKPRQLARQRRDGATTVHLQPVMQAAAAATSGSMVEMMLSHARGRR